ncbi:MAG: alpha/beta fold hydrolase [Halobacteriovoraceae bacterium]|jgi:alpha-beta hydrolase superfamily lysophospholipase|nr:alpha/beta fold hydrolase [Halobacteriovoraceae bacterium]
MFKISQGFHYQLNYISFTDDSNISQKIAKHSFTKETNKKHIVLFHGYHENTLYLKNIIHFFMEQNYNVFSYELPGHGNSSGDPYDIDSFNTYELHYNAVLKDLDKTKTYLFVSHSTGSVGMTKALIKNAVHPFSQIIFIAPLIRSHLWHVSFAFYLLMKYLTLFKKVKRFKRSRGNEYDHTKSNDPFYHHFIPLNWFAKLTLFNREIEKFSQESMAKIQIIYGTNDTVIDWKYSQKFYKKMFPAAIINKIPSGTHHMHMRDPAVKKLFFKTLEKLL